MAGLRSMHLFDPGHHMHWEYSSHVMQSAYVLQLYALTSMRPVKSPCHASTSALR